MLFVDYLIICLTEIFKSIKIIEGDNYLFATNFSDYNNKLLREVCLYARRDNNSLLEDELYSQTNNFRNMYYYYEKNFNQSKSLRILEKVNLRKKSQENQNIETSEDVFNKDFLFSICNNEISNSEYYEYNEINEFSPPTKSLGASLKKKKPMNGSRNFEIKEIEINKNNIFKDFDDSESQYTKNNESKNTYSMK